MSPAVAQASKSPKVRVTPQSGPPGTTFVISYSRGTTQGCKVTVRQGWAGGKRVFNKSIKRQGLSFVVKPSARLGSRQVTVRCGAKRGETFFDVVAASPKDQQAPSSPEADDLDPFGDEVVDQSEIDKLPALDAVGGEGASTRMPFARGAAYKVTQSRNGGTSHGSRTTRNAVDLAVPQGTPLLSGVSGTIVKVSGGCPLTRSDKCGSGFGNYVQIRAGDGTCYIYAHLSGIDVAQGTVVDRYRQVGRTGTSGYSTGPHLHIDRRDCLSGTSLEWSFDEVGSGPPRVGAVITSQNEPPASEPAPPVTPAPAPAPTPKPTWREQQGSRGANSFSNPFNASGQGPRLEPMTWVDVSCKVYAPQIASVNPDGYWYRIASAPWNNAYYIAANTFWNGDVPGQTPYTHNTDWSVPTC